MSPTWLPLVVDVPDFPQPGILFKDIAPILRDGAAFAGVVHEMAGACRPLGATTVVGIEARGFILAAPVAVALGVGFVPVRKPGKQPRATPSVAYALEYGEAVLHAHQDAFSPDERVLIVDDVLATGGTAAATVKLVRRCGAEVAGVCVLLELTALEGRAKLPGVDVTALASL
jgi:adenine phosphoribosyltransferase